MKPLSPITCPWALPSAAHAIIASDATYIVDNASDCLAMHLVGKTLLSSWLLVLATVIVFTRNVNNVVTAVHIIVAAAAAADTSIAAMHVRVARTRNNMMLLLVSGCILLTRCRPKLLPNSRRCALSVGVVSHAMRLL